MASDPPLGFGAARHNTEVKFFFSPLRKAMTETTEFERFAAYLKIADKMIEQASKDDIADTARVLALHLAHYRAQHGEIPLKKSFELLLTETLSDEQAGELADGFEVLIAVMKTLATPAEGRIRRNWSWRIDGKSNCIAYAGGVISPGSSREVKE